MQWVRRFSSSRSGLVSFFPYWCSVFLGKPASDVLACPSLFSTNSFPPFYRDFLVAWKEVDGSFFERRSSLIFASSSPHHVSAVSCKTSKCIYSFLISESRGDPDRVEKFLPLYGVIYWPTTWRELFFFDLDRTVIDLCWKIAHGVLFTADRLIGWLFYRLVILSTPAAFLVWPLNVFLICFFECPILAPVLGVSFFFCLLLWFVVMFSLALVLMKFAPFLVFSCICFKSVNPLFGNFVTIFAFVMFLPVRLW